MVGGVNEKGVPEDNFTSAQYLALREMISFLRPKAPQAEILGHRDLSPDKNGDGIITSDEWMKECPSFDVRKWCKVAEIKSKP
jgi:N-acetyl-anhydromuramyl-L-alanine amidase AmpD